MKLLLTNDDGIEAPGLEALRQVADGLGEILVAAPREPASGISHATTTDSPIRVNAHHLKRYSVQGTPADCVRVALHRHESGFDCVLAGINDGANLGVDVYHSGTAAAVREAAIHGLKAIAVSHYHNRPLEQADWRRAVLWTRPLIEDLLAQPSLPGQFWNVNLPMPGDTEDPPEVVYCALDPSPLPLSFREENELLHYNGRYSLRPRREDHDVDVCFGGKIAVTALQVTNIVP